MSKEWPEDPTKTVGLEKLLRPIRKSLDVTYDLVRKNEGEAIPYDGYPHCIGASLPPYEVLLDAESIRYDEEEQDRDPMATFLMMAFQMGFENGKRHEAERQGDKTLVMETKILTQKMATRAHATRLKDLLGYETLDAMYEAEEGLPYTSLFWEDEE